MNKITKLFSQLSIRFARKGIFLTLLFSVTAQGSGIATHMVHGDIGARAVEDAQLRQMMETYKSIRRGSGSFPDGGYPLDYSWAEPAHWAPFAKAYLENLQERCADKIETDKVCQKQLVHFMGAAGHGYQDQITDALLLPKIKEMDGDDGNADTYLDFFVLTHYDRRDSMLVSDYTPYKHLQEVFVTMGLGDVPFEQLLLGGTLLRLGNIGEHIITPLVTPFFRNELSWAYSNYRDYPGGTEQIGAASANFYEYYWERFNGEWVIDEDRLIPFPDADAVGVNPALTQTDALIGVILDRPVMPSSVTEDSFWVEDEAGNKIGGRFNLRTDPNSDIANSHMIIFKANETLQPFHQYTVTMTEEVLDELGLPITDGDGFGWNFITGGGE